MSNVTVKKAFVELIALLEANENKKVSTLMPQILELASGKSTAKTFYKDDNGNVIAVYCYYHKVWELVSEVEYGAKASTSTGLNTMCKDGVSAWTKQQRQAKVAKEALLEQVASGEVEASELTVKLQEIEEQRQVVIAQESSLGFDALEEALAHHNS